MRLDRVDEADDGLELRRKPDLDCNSMCFLFIIATITAVILFEILLLFSFPNFSRLGFLCRRARIIKWGPCQPMSVP